jgi:hypothetical protein
MNESKRKHKTICFRISEEEYASFKLLYRSRGARNLSDFARLSMQRLATQEDHRDSDLLVRVEGLAARIGVLEAKFDRLIAG